MTHPRNGTFMRHMRLGSVASCLNAVEKTSVEAVPQRSGGSFACSHSRRAAFIWDCQPRPRARNFSTTSVSKRMVVETFLLPTGRPRFARYAAMPASISAAVRGRSSSSTPSQTKSPPGGGFLIASRMALRVGRGVFLPLIGRRFTPFIVVTNIAPRHAHTRHCEEAIGRPLTKQSRGPARLLQANSRRSGLRNDGGGKTLATSESIERAPDWARTSSLHPPPSPRRKPGSRRSEDHAR